MTISQFNKWDEILSLRAEVLPQLNYVFLVFIYMSVPSRELG